MQGNYGASNMNQSFGGNSYQDQSMRGGQASMYASVGSPGKKTVPAGVLNSKTLAEENLKGFRLRNL